VLDDAMTVCVDREGKGIRAAPLTQLPTDFRGFFFLGLSNQCHLFIEKVGKPRCKIRTSVRLGIKTVANGERMNEKMLTVACC
jgi:hypothetical protein